MRVTTSSTYLTTARNLGQALSRTQEASQQISSGKRISTYSDDAPAAAAADGYRAQEADWTSFRRSADDAKGWLSTADGVLQSMSSLMARVKELAVSGQNGSLSASGRTAVADELVQLRDELRDLGNTEHLGRSLFGGFAPKALLTAEDGTVSTAADGARVQRQVSPTVVLSVNVDGRDLFGFDGAGDDVFTALKALADAVRAGDLPAAGQVQSGLERHMDAVGRGLSLVGSTLNRVEAADDAGGVALVTLAERRSELEEIDIAEAVVRLSSAQAGYQAALGATSRANLPTLADFLK